MGWIKKPEKYRELFAGARVFSVDKGEYHIVPERHEKPAGAIVARDVLVNGFAKLRCVGLINVYMLGGFVRAEENAQVTTQGGQVEAIGCAVEASYGAAVIAREASVVFVQHGNVVVHAYDDAIVILNPGSSARVRLFDRAQIVRWKRQPKELRAQLAAVKASS